MAGSEGNDRALYARYLDLCVGVVDGDERSGAGGCGVQPVPTFWEFFEGRHGNGCRVCCDGGGRRHVAGGELPLLVGGGAVASGAGPVVQGRGAGVAGSLDVDVDGALRGGTVVVGGVQGLLGLKTEKNRAKRAKKKRAKAKKRGECAELGLSDSGRSRAEVVAQEVPEWRRKGFGQHVGQFSGMSAEIQQQLRETRARALIAKNQREEREHLARVSAMDSPEAIFMKAMGLMEVAARAAKSSRDSKVMGWVATVASSHAESLAKSAPSSMPSFSSITTPGSGAGSFDPSVKVLPLNVLEAKLVADGKFTVESIQHVRASLGRVIQRADLYKIVPVRQDVYDDAYDF